MNKLLTKIAGLSIGLAMAIGVGVAVGSKEAKPVHAADPTVTYTATSASAVSTSGTPVTGSSATLSSTGAWNSGGVQMTNGKNMSLTITGYAGYTITGLSVSVRSNSSKGTGSLTFTIGGTTKASIAESAFNSANWHGSWSTTYVAVTPTLTSTTVGTGQNMVLTIACKSGSSNYNSLYFSSVTLTYKSAKTELTGITLGGAASQNALSIGSSDLTAKTVSVTLNPTNATDPKVNIAHQSGTSGLFTVSSSATCTSGSGSFTVTGKGNTSGSETFRISGNTETSVYVDLVVTALDDSATYWTVSFDVNGGSATIADMEVEDGDTFEFPSPGTKDHYSFDGWSSDGGNTLYDAGDESPAVGDDIEYTAYWTQDAQTTVIYKSGDGTGSDISSTEYAGSYSLASFPGTWTAPSGKAFSKWSDGSSQYSAGANYTLVGNTTVTFTAVYKAVDEYTLFSGDLVEGDYVICSGTKAMKNETTSSPRIDVADVTVTNNKIVDPDASIIWHIAQDGDYWTIYNAAVEKYAAFTGTNGRGTLIDSVTDYARFSTEDSYEFINVGNSGKYLRYNPTYGFASYSSSTGVSLTLYKLPSNELSSIALSGDYKTSFPSGETFSFGGTVTASYTLNDPANVTSSTTFHLDSADGTNMSGVTMTHAAHDGHTIYAKYTEGGITKTATYSISVANAPVSSLTIASNTGKVTLNDYFDMSEIGVTILPADAVQTYEWTVLSNTVNDDYEFDADIVAAKNTAGTITLKCTSTADSSKYQTFVLTVSGNPVVSLPNSVTLYTGKTTTVTASVEGGTSPYSYSWSITSGGSYASISSGGSSATVTLSGSAAGSVTLQCSVTDSNSKSDSASVTFSVIASAVTEVNWSASAFDVFSGVTIPSNIDDTWEVNYEKNNGDNGYLVFGEYDLYLGSKEITSLPYTFVAEDDGESLHVEYGGVSSSSVAVAVTQTINSVKASSTSTDTSDLTFTAACGGSGTADDSKAWTITSDGTESSFDSQNGKGIHYGTGSAAVQYIKLTSNAFTSGKITKVEVNASTASGVTATVSITVGGEAFGGDPQSLTSSAVPDNPYTFTGEVDADTIEVLITKPSSAVKALYCKSVVVTYVTSSGEQEIANVAAHKAAQRVAVKFANAFNAAMATTTNCTDSEALASAWSTCSSAYDTFKSEAAALGSAEEAYAKNLIKYATAQYSDDSGEACIERMMKTYQVCVQKHGKTAFMSELVSLGRISNNPLQLSVKNTSATIIVVVISAISAAAIGGYFLFRKKKED